MLPAVHGGSTGSISNRLGRLFTRITSTRTHLVAAYPLHPRFAHPSWPSGMTAGCHSGTLRDILFERSGRRGVRGGRSGCSPLASCVRLPPWVTMQIVTPWGNPVTPPEADTPAQRRAAFRAWARPRLLEVCCPSRACPRPGAGSLQLHQVRSRAAWSPAPEDDQRVLIARAICTICQATHTLLPDFLAPFGGIGSRSSTPWSVTRQLRRRALRARCSAGGTPLAR